MSILKGALERLVIEAHSHKQKELQVVCTQALDKLNQEIEALVQADKASDDAVPNIVQSTSKQAGESTGPVGNLNTVNGNADKSESEARNASPTQSVKEADDISVTSNRNSISGASIIGRPGEDLPKIPMDNYWKPFRVACDSSMPVPIRVIALDALQKIIAHGLLKGSAIITPPKNAHFRRERTGDLAKLPNFSEFNDLSHIDSNSLFDGDTTPKGAAPANSSNYPNPARLIDDVVHTICTGFAGQQTDQTVTLQILKVLLTFVTSDTCQVHGISLLKVIQTCCNIYCFTRNAILQATAKAELTQMANLIVTRCEEYAVQLENYETSKKALKNNNEQNEEENSKKRNSVEVENATGKQETPQAYIVAESDSKPVESDKSEDLINHKKNGSNDSAVEWADATESPTGDVVDSVVNEKRVAIEADEAPEPEQVNEPSISQDDVSVISSNNIGLDQEEPTESTETSVDDSELAKLSENKGSDLAMDEMPAEPQTTPETAPDQTSAPDPNANLEGDQPNTKVLPIEAKLLQRNRPRKSSLSPKVDLKIIVPPRETTVRRKPVQDKPSHPTRGRFNTLRKDLYLVFRFFCRLSMRTDTGGNIQMEEISIRGRALVLELILSMLDNSGPVFQVEDAYISLIRQALCVSLSQNGVSSNEQLFELSLSIFLMLFRLYRAPLKKELEVLFAEIYLRFLDMSNATYKQKQMVLQGLMKICSNPQSLVDVYLNYDCDLSMTSVFEKTVNTLSRVAQGRSKNVSGSAMGSIIGAHASGLLLDNKADLVALQEKKLKVRGLKCLVTIVRSLVEWCKDLDNKETGISQPEKAKPPETAEDKTTIIFSKNPLLNISMKEFSTAHGNNSNISIGISDSEDNPAQYQEIMTRKQTLQTGIRLFNTKPQKGIDFFIIHDFFKNDTQSIVSFFASTPGLSKAAIGEYLGESDPEAIKIMYAFVDSLDFKGLQFVDALRTFLQTFRLPGESQKIDRIMEKFADRYCENNPDVFANADTAYILAYSIIMLNTDQHSVQVKRRMDKSEFIKNNRGINNNNDLPDEFLGAIFDDIAVNEIVMEEEQISEVAKTAINIANERERQQMYDKEISQMQKKSQALLSSSRQDQKASIWRSATHSDHVKPMFVVACWPLMATLSVVFEESENISTTASKGNEFAQANSEAIELCLDGFMGAIRISSVFRMDVERDAFVSSLAKLTGLNHVDEMRSKNVAAIRTLLSAANAYGEGLQTSWLIVLKTISAMERYQLINSSGSVTYSTEDASGLDYSPQNQSTTGVINNHSSASAAVRNITRRGSLGGLMREFQSQSTIIAIDRIFTSSVKLSSDAIVHFVNALCTVSLEEVDASRTAPRMYSLQRIVEIAYYNMSRIRFEWTQIWKILQPHFNTVGCHPNNIVATFAIDSLRQLSMKFLERDELSHYNTQSEFMKPFEHIIRNNSSPAIRELIIHSLIQMISARAKNIKSGWKSIFIVFGRAAGDENPQLVDNAFGTVRLVYQKHLDLIGLSFGEFVNCLVEFAFNAKVEEIINESIRMMQGCVKLLVKDIEEGDKKNQNISSTFAASSPTTTSVTKKRLQHIEEEQFFFKWFPIVSGLSRLVIDHDSQVVRTKALDALFDILRNTGYLFETSYWSKILKNVIIPIFEDIKESTQLQLPTTGDFQRREATTEIWIQTIRLMVDLYTRFHDLFKDNSEYLLELLELFVALLKRKNEKLGQTGIRCFHNLIARNGSRFDSSTWGAVTDTLEQIFTATTPKELLEVEITGVHENTDAKHTSQVIVGASNPVPDDITDTGAGVGGTSRRNQHNPPATPGKVDVDFPNAIIKCAAQLIIIQSVKDLALTVATPSSKDKMHYLAQMPAEYRNRWLRCLYNSYQFAHDFNANHELRHALFKSGYVQQMPNLTKQETLSLSVFLSILYDLYRTLGDDDPDLLPPLIEESTKVLERFITLLSADMMQNQQRDINNWSPLVITVLRELCATPWEESRGVVRDEFGEIQERSGEDEDMEKFEEAKRRATRWIGLRKHVPEFYRLSLKMIGVDRADVREYMQEFLEKIGNEFLNPDRWDV